MLIELSIVLLFLGLLATAIYVIATFLRIRLSTLFIDFVVFLASIIVAVAMTLNPHWSGFPIVFSIFLYINALWLYGVESRTVSMRRASINPSISRVFIGLILYLIATWITFSTLDVRLGAIIALASLILGAYRMKRIEKTT